MENQSIPSKIVTTLIEIASEEIPLQMEIQVGGDETNINYTAAVIESLDEHLLPLYTRIITAIAIIIILFVGTVGNTMVTLVIANSRDMRTSTNIFLVNLSVADLLVLLIITPTALLEVLYHPEIWLLGPAMCKLVPFLELTVCHASVLTILAISFERYLAICNPLQANYVCTRARAVSICAVVWISAALITSPTFFMTDYFELTNENGEIEPHCYMSAGSLWKDLYTISTILLFFLLPVAILLITFWMIAQRLTMDQSELTVKNENIRGRRQVVLMLGTVVFIFFLCLLPFRLLTLFVLFSDPVSILVNHSEAYYNALYFCRIMSYINSAINPILYNIMSTKFRNGFKRLCGRKGKQFIFHRNGTFLTLTTTTSVNLPLNMNNNNTPTTISTSASTSPELNVALIRKNGIRNHHNNALYRYSTQYSSSNSTAGRNLHSSSLKGSPSTSSQNNWPNNRSTSERICYKEFQPIPTSSLQNGKAQILSSNGRHNSSKKCRFYSLAASNKANASSASATSVSILNGRKNESML